MLVCDFKHWPHVAIASCGDLFSGMFTEKAHFKQILAKWKHSYPYLVTNAPIKAVQFSSLG